MCPTRHRAGLSLLLGRVAEDRLAALDGLGLDADPMVQLLDLSVDFVNADGTLKKNLFSPDNIHLTQEGGYELYATKLKPVVEKLLGGAAP